MLRGSLVRIATLIVRLELQRASAAADVLDVYRLDRIGQTVLYGRLDNLVFRYQTSTERFCTPGLAEKKRLDNVPNRFRNLAGRPAIYRVFESATGPPIRILTGQVVSHLTSAGHRLTDTVGGDERSLFIFPASGEEDDVLGVEEPNLGRTKEGRYLVLLVPPIPLLQRA